MALTAGQKKVLVVGTGAAVVGGVLFLAMRKASASTNPSTPPKAFGLLDVNAATAACGGSWQSFAGINAVSPELFQLMTPGGNPHSGTVYGFFKDRLFRYVGQNNAGYYECTNVDVAKLRGYTGAAGAPSGLGQIPGLYKAA